MIMRRPTWVSSSRHLLPIAGLTGSLLLLTTGLHVGPSAHAQATLAITSSGLNTNVTKSGNIYDITGGTRPGSGPNLFHSFGEFSVPTSDIANFLNETAIPTSNILGRVTGGNPSNIFGTLQTTGFGNANLFLMNPAGILFGPNASLNVGGSVSFTTADYLRLTDGAKFTAIPSPQDAAVSSAPVAAFGFLGTNPSAITVQGGQLAVSEGHAISLVGGNITIEGATLAPDNVQPARIYAPGGQINLVSVASPGEVLASSLQSEPNLNGQSFTNMGNISLSGGSTLDVSANAAGTIKIRGGQLMITDATLSADTVNSSGSSPAIDIHVTGDFSITDTRGAAAITAITTGAGNAGAVFVSSGDLTATTTSFTENATVLIDTHSSGSGGAGAINITTGNLSVAGSGGISLFIGSGTQGIGPGGDVTISANTVELTSAQISTSTFLAEISGQEASGPSGNLTITANRLQLTDAHLDTSAAFPVETQQAGDVTLNVRDINMINSSVAASGFVGGGITIHADTLVTDATQFTTFTELSTDRGIKFEGRDLALTNGSAFTTSTFGDGAAGNIDITATGQVSLLGITGENPIGQFNPSGLFSNSFGFFGTQGSSGNIAVRTPRLTMNQGRINTSTATSGRGGNVTINAGTVSMSGEFPNTFGGDFFFALTDIHPSGIFTQTIGSEFCTGGCGDAGSITTNIRSLSMGPGSQINSGTTSTGKGGATAINAAETIAISGRLTNGDPVGIFSRTVGSDPNLGQGGDISLAAGRSVSLSNGAAISASSTGPANAGNITINAGAQFLSQNASVTTQASQASGGNVTVQATDSIRLVNSQINTSVQGGPTTSGGNITIDPAVMTLQNSQILAQAVQGTGGNINIVAGTFLSDQTSLVSASSQFGLSGSVDIQSPVSSLSNTLATLPQRPLQAQPLLTQRCAAQMNGQLSSLVIAGRDALPVEPGGWLMSPLAMMTGDEPIPHAHVATHEAFEVPQSIETHVRPGSYQHAWSLPRGVIERAAGCGS